MSAWASSWRASLRIARREVGRHRARNTLIVAMLALPIFGAVTVDTVVHSEQRSVPESLTRQLGRADALVSSGSGGSPIYQTPDVSGIVSLEPPSQAASGTASGGVAARPIGSGGARAAILRVLPGATLLDYASGFETEVHTPDGFLSLNTVQFDLADPATAGMLDLSAGRMPLAPGEILLSTAASQQLGTGIGASVTVPDRSGAFLVVGIANDPNALQAATVYGMPNALAADPEANAQWLVLDRNGVPWSAVKQLNAAGLLVTSRDVIANPPPRSDVPFYAYAAQHPGLSSGSSTADNAAKLAIALVAVGLVLLEVVLLAGPAFAVSARRRQREFALIGAAGADSSDLRRMVLADGLVLGAVAGVLGAGAGIGGAAAVMPFISRFTHVVPGGFQVRPLEVLGAAVLAALLGLAAAAAPARAVARQDILLSLTGRRAPQQVRWKLPLGGLVLIGAGAVAMYESPRLWHKAVFGSLGFVLGVALLEIGMIMCTPLLVGGLARIGRVLPLGPRLALRDGARHRGRTTPAVAAMFAAVAGAVAAGTWFVSVEAQERAAYQPSLLPNQVAVADVSGATQQVGPDALAADLKAVLPVVDSFTVTAADQAAVTAPGGSAVTVAPVLPCSNRQGRVEMFVGTAGDACNVPDFAAAITGSPILDPLTFTRLTGVDSPAATAMLNQGGAIVFDPHLLHNGRVTFEVDRMTNDVQGSANVITSGGSGGSAAPLPTVVLPGAYVDLGDRPKPEFALSPAAAKRLGVTGGRQTLVLDLSRHITSQELQRANKVLAQAGIAESLWTENGYQSRIGAVNLIILAIAVLVAVGAAGIATGLAIADGQQDLETLAAVGGSPGARRLLAGSTALVITGLGSAIGVPIGFAMAGGLMQFRTLWLVSAYVTTNSVAPPGQATPFVVPWLNLAVAVAGIPLVTAAGAMLLTRSKVQLSRRMT